MKHVFLLIMALMTTSLLPLHAAEYFVAPDGDDANSGTEIGLPFRTIQRAADAVAAGDTCFIRAGVYRESVLISKSGEKDKPITFSNYRGERAIVDGSDLVASPWVQAEGNIWKTELRVAQPIEAIFFDGRMLVEARWPDCPWEENWVAEKKWALTGAGTTLGQIESAKLAESGVDLSGGLAYIKLSKGNNCFTRAVASHRGGSETLTYDPTGIEGRAWGEDSMPERIKAEGLEGNRFFVVARGALDAPGEWWHDIERGELLVIAPDGRQPAAGAVSVKARVAGFEGRGTSDVIIEGLEFRGCNVQFAKCRRVVLRNCRFLYPSTPKVFQDLKTARRTQKNLHVDGEENVVERCLIEWAVDTALEIEGAGNRVENCVVHDCNLHGRHPGPGISAHGTAGPSDGDANETPDSKGSAQTASRTTAPNIVRRCTVYNVGGVGIYASGTGPAELDRNHVFNAGLYCVDIASLYVPVGRKMSGTVVHHNWLHDIHGIGFRVDIEGREIVFHHNLVWNAAVGCKMQGFQLEGYNNTLMVNNPEGGLIVVFEQAATSAERAEWRVRNNAAYFFLDRMSWRSDYENATRPFMMPLKPEEGTIDYNATIQAGVESEFFVDAARYDFRPKPGGPLDAAGVVVPGFAEGSAGSPPSIGALETHEAPWTAGAGWMNDGLPAPASAKAATELAHRLRPANCTVATPPNAGSPRP